MISERMRKTALLGACAATMLVTAPGDAAERGRMLRNAYGCQLRDDYAAFDDLSTSRDETGATQYMATMISLLRCRSLRAGLPVLITSEGWAGLVCVQPSDQSVCLWTTQEAVGD